MTCLVLGELAGSQCPQEPDHPLGHLQGRAGGGALGVCLVSIYILSRFIEFLVAFWSGQRGGTLNFNDFLITFSNVLVLLPERALLSRS